MTCPCFCLLPRLLSALHIALVLWKCLAMGIEGSEGEAAQKNGPLLPEPTVIFSSCTSLAKLQLC